MNITNLPQRISAPKNKINKEINKAIYKNNNFKSTKYFVDFIAFVCSVHSICMYYVYVVVIGIYIDVLFFHL